MIRALGLEGYEVTALDDCVPLLADELESYQKAG